MEAQIESLPQCSGDGGRAACFPGIGNDFAMVGHAPPFLNWFRWWGMSWPPFVFTFLRGIVYLCFRWRGSRLPFQWRFNGIRVDVQLIFSGGSIQAIETNMGNKWKPRPPLGDRLKHEGKLRPNVNTHAPNN